MEGGGGGRGREGDAREKLTHCRGREGVESPNIDDLLDAIKVWTEYLPPPHFPLTTKHTDYPFRPLR